MMDAGVVVRRKKKKYLHYGFSLPTVRRSDCKKNLRTFGFVMAVTGSVVVTRERGTGQACADGAKVEMGISEKHTARGCSTQ